jgi:putative spermidine/putrescine transport system ATP-binding protein
VGTVSQVEYCGRDYLVDVLTEAGTLYLRTERRLQPEDRVQLSIPPERVLVFPSENDADPAASSEPRAS